MMTTASHKASIKAARGNGKQGFTVRTLLALLSELAFLDEVESHSWTSSEVDHLDAKGREILGGQKWIMYPLVERAEIEGTIRWLIRGLATEHGIPASYPPMG
jgi:hypothetical protein